MFVPQDNIKRFTTEEHRGLATLWQAGQGMDVKGILKRPIKIDDYPLPWEFHLGLMQSFDAMVSLGTKTQANYAIGLNVAVTFSDPETWPEDRTQRPPDTRSLQLLVAHLGNYGLDLSYIKLWLDEKGEAGSALD